MKMSINMKIMTSISAAVRTLQRWDQGISSNYALLLGSTVFNLMINVTTARRMYVTLQHPRPVQGQEEQEEQEQEEAAILVQPTMTNIVSGRTRTTALEVWL